MPQYKGDMTQVYHDVRGSRFLFDHSVGFDGVDMEGVDLEGVNMMPGYGYKVMQLGEEADAPRTEARKQILLYGLLGAVLGGVATGLLTALAFHAHAPEKPILTPALIMGVGSFGVAGLGIGLLAATLRPEIAVLTQGVALAK